MLDYCGRNGCPVYAVSRSLDSRPRMKPWYCSAKCRDIATRPMHWLPEPSYAYVACGSVDVGDKPHLTTPCMADVTCQNCMRTGIWRQAVKAA